MDETLKYPKGTAIAFTHGEYSDYELNSVIVTIVDCDLPALAVAYAKEVTKGLPPDVKHDDPDPRDFAGWLIANGHAMPAEVQTVHLGSYCEFAEEFGVGKEYQWRDPDSYWTQREDRIAEVEKAAQEATGRPQDSIVPPAGTGGRN